MVIQSIHTSSAFPHGRLQKKWGDPIVKTMSSYAAWYAHLEFHKGPLRQVWAAYGQCLVLQSSSVISGRVKHRPWLELAFMRLCYSTEGVHWTSASRRRPGKLQRLLIVLRSLIYCITLSILLSALIWFCNLVGSMWLENYIRTLHAGISSLWCSTVVHITSKLGRLAHVSVGDAGTIPFTMRKERKDFPGASCDSKIGAGDAATAVVGGTSTLLSWSGQQANKLL